MSDGTSKDAGANQEEYGIYMCTFCGYVFDEEKEGKRISELKVCPTCQKPAYVLELLTK